MPPRKAASPDLPTYDKRVFRLSKADIKVSRDSARAAQGGRAHNPMRSPALHEALAPSFPQADLQEIERLLAEQQQQLGIAHGTRSSRR